MKINNSQKLNQWKKRVLCVRFIYSLLVTSDSKENSIKKFQEEIVPLNNKDVTKIIATFFLKKDEIKKLIQSKLHEGWSIERINLVDLAIIYEAICEHIALKTDKKILIDQAVITSKKYCEPNSYKFINSILDKILK